MSTTARHETLEWSEIYRSTELLKRRKRSHRSKLEKLGIFEAERSSQVLDVCCGTGEMLEILQDQGFRRLFGIDLEPGLKSQEGVQKFWRYTVASAEDLPFAASSFDWIVCAHSLHHLKNFDAIEKFIAQAHRSLKKGGQLALIDHYNSWQLRLALALFRSPLGLLTPYTRDFRKQILEEDEYFNEFLRNWPKLHAILNRTPFQKVKMKKDLFFFYWRGEK